VYRFFGGRDGYADRPNHLYEDHVPIINSEAVSLYVADDDFVRPWRDHYAVVLQHGFCRNSGFWLPWVPLLAGHYRVVRPDLRGCGRSSDPGPDHRLTIDDYVNDLFAVLDGLGIDSAHYVGEATGAFVGMAAAQRRPDTIRSLTFFNTPMGASASTQQVYSLGHESWADAIRALGVEGWWRQAGQAESASRGSSQPSSGGALAQELHAASEYYIREAGRTPAHVAIAMLSLSSGLDVTELLRGVTRPTRFIAPAKYSFNTSREQLCQLAALVPGATVQEIDVRNRSGLYCFHSAEIIAPDVLEFLLSVDGEQLRLLSERG
jgi:pimeloyl-ACP methyl ester carboxylesterase